METFTLKIGGGCLTSADQIRKIPKIPEEYRNKYVALIFSALGKTTDKLENLAEAVRQNASPTVLMEMIKEIQFFHIGIIEDLFSSKSHRVVLNVDWAFEDLTNIVLGGKDILKHKALKDHIVSMGEIISGLILEPYLWEKTSVRCCMIPIDLVKTDLSFGHIKVNEEATIENMKEKIRFNSYEVRLIHGFIGSGEIEQHNPHQHSSNQINLKFRTTIGREGSDYTAALVASALSSKEVVFFKNVPGIMTMDPNIPGGEDAKLIPEMSYERAEQLLHGTAKRVLHENTIRVLKEKRIPIRVRSFDNLSLPGTIIS